MAAGIMRQFGIWLQEGCASSDTPGCTVLSSWLCESEGAAAPLAWVWYLPGVAGNILQQVFLPFDFCLRFEDESQQETYPWQKPQESLQWQVPLSELGSTAGVWLWGTEVGFSDVTDSKCCKWLFAEAELKNNNHFQVFLLPLPFPLVRSCYFSNIWERHKAFRLDDFRTTVSLGLHPDLNNAESCKILDGKRDNSKGERGKKPSLKVLWKSSAGREGVNLFVLIHCAKYPEIWTQEEVKLFVCM